jgi:hypothetical protein
LVPDSYPNPFGLVSELFVLFCGKKVNLRIELRVFGAFVVKAHGLKFHDLTDSRLGQKGKIKQVEARPPRADSFRPGLQGDFNYLQEFLAGGAGGRLNGQAKVDCLHVARERVRVRVGRKVAIGDGLLEARA